MVPATKDLQHRVDVRQHSKMTDVLSNAHNSDKVTALVKEAENLKSKLEEERQKLNDVARELKLLFALLALPWAYRSMFECPICLF